MNNLYHKVAVASVCTTLSFILGANTEAKAIGIQFGVEGNSSTGMGESVFSGGRIISVQKTQDSPTEGRLFAEFDFAGFSVIPPGGSTSRASFQVIVQFAERIHRDLYLDLFGYVGNGRADLSDFNAGVRLGSVSVFTPYPDSRPVEFVDFDVTQFVNQRVRNGDNFWGFGIRVQNSSSFLNYGRVDVSGTSLSLSGQPEPIPEPTTIFGSALALSLGGWLKRKNSSRQNKTTPQR